MTNKEKKAYEQWLNTCRRIADATAPIPQESEQDKQTRLTELLKPENFEQFCKYYFPHYIDCDFGWFHKKAADAILNNQDVFAVLEWAREHAKSVFADIFIPLWLLAVKQLTGMILASENQDKASVLIGDIEAELRNNKRYIADFGEQYIHGSWLQGHFMNGDAIGFWAFGLGQNPAGTRKAQNRPNYGVVDDADSKRKSKNQQRIVEDINWVLGEFMGCLSIKGARFVYANNRVSKNGITAHIVGDVEETDPKREGITHIKVYATENPKTHQMLLPHEGGKPAWKERYTLAKILARIQKLGTHNAMRQFYHQDVEDELVFSSEMIQWLTPRDLSYYDAIITYCDPSFSTSPTSDYTAIKVWARKGLQFICLKAYVRQRETIYKALCWWYDWYYALPTQHQSKVKNFIEAEGMQQLLTKDAIRKINTERGVVMPIRFDSQSAKGAKSDRIADMVTRYEAGLVFYNQDEKKDKDMMEALKQLKAWHEKATIDDSPDADAGAWSKLSTTNYSSAATTSRAGKYKRPKNR